MPAAAPSAAVLARGARVVAALACRDEIYLPVFDRLDKELALAEAAADPLELARTKLMQRREAA